jgi:hypothetical protein
VRVHPPNQPPQVSAGPGQSIQTSATVVRGTVTDDDLPVGSTISVQWSKVSGAEVLFANPTSRETAVSFGASGRYVLRLSATDGLASASSEVTIDVDAANVAPLVSAGEDQHVTLPARTAQRVLPARSCDGEGTGP